MNEVEHERNEEQNARSQHALACLNAIIADRGGLAGLARCAYKYTDCGASLGALLHAGDDNPGKWVYGNTLRDIQPGDVAALSVSSIVEGVETTTGTHVIDLFDEKFETPAMAVTAYDAALQAVEDEASGIWNETHGCETCAKHFGGVASNGIETCEGDDGCTPVWDACPDCKGRGSIV